MTLPNDQKLKTQEIEPIRKPVENVDIRAIHPDKMEEWAEHLVRKLKK